MAPVKAHRAGWRGDTRPNPRNPPPMFRTCLKGRKGTWEKPGTEAAKGQPHRRPAGDPSTSCLLRAWQKFYKRACPEAFFVYGAIYKTLLAQSVQREQQGRAPKFQTGIQRKGFPAEQYAVRSARNCDGLGLSGRGRRASCSSSGRLQSQAIETTVRILRSTAFQEIP